MCIDVVRSQLRAALDVLLADADRVAAVQPDVALEAAERVARASRDAAKLEEWLHRSGIDLPTTVGMIAQRWSRWEAGEQQHWAVRIAEAFDGAPAASSTAAHGGAPLERQFINRPTRQLQIPLRSRRRRQPRRQLSCTILMLLGATAY